MKPEWGHKHTCTNCHATFYDMQKPEPSCPKCGTPVAAGPPPIALTTEELSADAADAPKKPVDPLDAIEIAVDDTTDTDADTYIEDTNDLVGDDVNDMSEVIDHIDEGVVDKNTE